MQKRLSFRGRDFLIHCEERMSQDPSWFSFEDESDVRERDWKVEEGDVVLDVGSAYGSYTLTALASGAKHVVCFNPNKEENEFLRKSLGLNWDWKDKVRIVEAGLFAHGGWYHESGNFSNEFVEGYFPVQALDTMQMSLLDLPEHDRMWVKIDVEGAEVEVLRGMRQFLAAFRPILLVEKHIFKNPLLQPQAEALLKTFGYKAVSHLPHHVVVHSLYKPEGAGG